MLPNGLMLMEQGLSRQDRYRGTDVLMRVILVEVLVWCDAVLEM